MKKISKEQEQQIICEVKSIIAEFSLSNISTKIILKQGGYSGTASQLSNTIWIRIDVWLKFNIFNKQLLIIHEILHLKGLSHSAIKMFSNAGIDFLTLSAYEVIYGIDNDYRTTQEGCKEMVCRYFNRLENKEGI